MRLKCKHVITAHRIYSFYTLLLPSCSLRILPGPAERFAVDFVGLLPEVLISQLQLKTSTIKRTYSRITGII